VTAGVPSLTTELGPSVKRLHGKVAVVTGAASGLGEAVGRMFADEGASVVIADVAEAKAASTADAIRAAGGDATAIAVDVRDAESVRALIESSVKRYKQLDIVIANAGVLGEMGVRLTESSDKAFRDTFDVNLFGVYHCFKYGLPMITGTGDGTGALIATSSVAAHRGVARLDAYSASKAAIAGLVRSVAADVGPQVRVNAVAPSTMRTSIADGGDRSVTSITVDDNRRGHGGIIADLRKVAAAFVYLASEDGSMITGQSICIDGGRTVFD
jgi:NAD(P)-dependent dehydrogenase (short-subunit alcohol dehydrogenase family)